MRLNSITRPLGIALVATSTMLSSCSTGKTMMAIRQAEDVIVTSPKLTPKKLLILDNQFSYVKGIKKELELKQQLANAIKNDSKFNVDTVELAGLGDPKNPDFFEPVMELSATDSAKLVVAESGKVTPKEFLEYLRKFDCNKRAWKKLANTFKKSDTPVKGSNPTPGFIGVE